MARNSSVRQALDAALHPLRLNAVLEVEQLATVMGLVEAGLGISVVPALTLFHFRRETLVTRPLPVPAAHAHGSTWSSGATAACRWRRRRCTTWWWRGSARYRFSP